MTIFAPGAVAAAHGFGIGKSAVIGQVVGTAFDDALLQFDALADEAGDPDSLIGRRLSTMTGFGAVHLHGLGDEGMTAAPILTIPVPPEGIAMGMIEDLCLTAQNWMLGTAQLPRVENWGAWDARRDGDAVRLRMADVVTSGA